MTWDIVGQERAVETLRRAVADAARLSHAYLFSGPEHVGRATVARRFAQALNCESLPSPPAPLPLGEGRPDLPCGECRACRLIAEGKHPDVEWVGVGGFCDESDHDHAKDNSRDIRICQIRHLERAVNRAPYEGRVRVVVVEPAEAMTAEAANAFLKTLEEPPADVVLVLITAREERLPETVRSRCRRIAFGGVPREEIEVALRERWDADPERAARLARLAEGRLGWAVSVLADETPLVEREAVLDEIEELLAGGDVERFAYARDLSERHQRNAERARQALDAWEGWWRDVLLAAAGREDLVVESVRLDTLRSHAQQYGVGGAVRALRALRAGRQHVDENANPTLAFEVMLLTLPRAGERVAG